MNNAEIIKWERAMKRQIYFFKEVYLMYKPRIGALKAFSEELKTNLVIRENSWKLFEDCAC